LSFDLARRHVRAGLGRVTLSVVAIALGVALMVAFRLMNAAVLQSFMETVDALAGRAAFRIVAGERVTFSEEMVGTIATLPGVDLAVPLVRAVTFPDDGSGELLTVHGVDLTHDAAVRLYHATDDSEEVIDDLVVFLSQPDSIVVGREFAESRGLGQGDTIALVTPRGVKPFTVRGLLDPQGVARTLRGRLVVMDLYAAQRAFTADGQITQIDVLVTDAAVSDDVKAAVVRTLPPGLWVEEPAMRKDVIRKTVRGFQAILTAFSVVAVLSGFVICYSRLRVVLEARTWEVGLLRAIGLRRSVVFTELLKEGVLLGVAGAIIGIPLGIFAAHVGLPVLITATAINFRLPVTSAHTGMDLEVIALGLLAGLLAAVAAAAFPALRLARTHPVAALTGRGRETPPVLRLGRWTVPICVVIVIAGLIVAQRAIGMVVLGHVTTAFIAVAACVLAGPLLRSASPALTTVWRSLFGPTGALAASHIVREPRRTALTAATLGVGLGAVLLFGVLGWSFERSLVSQLSQRMRADLIVSSPFVSAGYVSAPLSDELVAQLIAIPGVAVAAGHHIKDVPYGDSEIAVAAFDRPALVDTRVNDWPLEAGAQVGALESVARGAAVLVTSSFAQQFDITPGQKVLLQSPRGPVAFEVGAVTDGLLESGIVMSRDLYRATWNDSLVTWVYVVLESHAEVLPVRAAIERELGRRYRLQVQSSAALIDFFAGEVRRAFSALYLMEGIIFLLVLVGIGDTLAAGVVERTREFGMMRAIGAHRSRLFGIVMLEGAVIGILGLLLAVCTGIALGVFWVEVQFPAVLGWKLELHFPALFAAAMAVATLVLCIAGSVLPSRRAARLSVPAALRYE
jgi:putative ABC transport system permease protein